MQTERRRNDIPQNASYNHTTLPHAKVEGTVYDTKSAVIPSLDKVCVHVDQLLRARKKNKKKIKSHFLRIFWRVV